MTSQGEKAATRETWRDGKVSAPEQFRSGLVSSRRALCGGVAGVCALIVLLLLPRFSPAATVTQTATDLAAGRDGGGFYLPEIDALGNRYVWAGPNAVAGFDFTSRKPLTITVELRSAATVGGPDAPVHLRVDDHELATVRPDARQYDFQPYRVTVPHVNGPITQITLISIPFGPRREDGRELGVMVRAITVDRTEAWSTITRRAWLYWLLPLCALLIAARLLLLRSLRSSSRCATALAVADKLMGYEAVSMAFIAAGAMFGATALLLSIGELDRSTYYVWLFGTAYLALLSTAGALALPFGDRDAPSLGWRIAHVPYVRGAHVQLQMAGRLACFSGVLLFALGFFAYYGTGDVDRKLKWMGNVRAYGLIEAYRRIPDQYPPLTLTLLALMGRLGGRLHLTDFVAFKLSLMVLFALTGAAFLWWRRDLLLAAALLLALLPNALALGYTDIYFAPTLVLTLWALQRRRFVAFSLLLAVTCLTKWQAAIIAPPLIIAAVRFATSEIAPEGDTTRPRLSLVSLRRLMAITLPGLVVTIGVIALFGESVFASLAHGFGERFLSANALNAPWLLTQALHLAAAYRHNGAVTDARQAIQTTDVRLTLGPKLLFAAFYLFALLRLWRGTRTFVVALRWTLAAYLAYFAFNTGVHENHLFTAVLLAAALASVGGAWEHGVFIAIALIANINLVLFYGLRGAPRLPPSLIGPLDWSVPLAGVAVTLVVVFFVVNVRAEQRVTGAVGVEHDAFVH